MKGKEFYKQKTKHDLKDNCGTRLTGKELFDLMQEYADSQKRETLIKFTLWTYKDYKYKELGKPQIEKVVDEYLSNKIK